MFSASKSNTKNVKNLYKSKPSPLFMMLYLRHDALAGSLVFVADTKSSTTTMQAISARIGAERDDPML